MGENDMTEREKMPAGELYDCGDPELIEQWHAAKNLTLRYNSLKSDDFKRKQRILKKLLGGCGENVWITSLFYVDYGNNIFLGNHCEINLNCVFLDDNRIEIGDYALIGPSVQIYTAFHPADFRERFALPRKEGEFAFCRTQTAPVKIGNGVWIGGGAVILPGVTIGDNVTIGAGSVVTHSIPSYTIACGNPCRPIRSITEKPPQNL